MFHMSQSNQLQVPAIYDLIVLWLQHVTIARIHAARNTLMIIARVLQYEELR